MHAQLTVTSVSSSHLSLVPYPVQPHCKRQRQQQLHLQHPHCCCCCCQTCTQRSASAKPLRLTGPAHCTHQRQQQLLLLHPHCCCQTLQFPAPCYNGTLRCAAACTAAAAPSLLPRVCPLVLGSSLRWPGSAGRQAGSAAHMQHKFFSKALSTGLHGFNPTAVSHSGQKLPLCEWLFASWTTFRPPGMPCMPILLRWHVSAEKRK